MSVVKRQGDEPGADHTGERHPSINWQEVAPRWLLVTVIAILTFSVGWLVGTNKSLSDDRLGRIESAQKEWRLAVYESHGDQLVTLRGEVRALQVTVGELKSMADDVRRIRIYIEESRKKRNGGGYGL